MWSPIERWREPIDDRLETVLPPTVTDECLREWIGPAREQYDVTAVQETLADPVWDLLDRGGKRWRAVLAAVCFEALDAEPRAHLDYACIPELVHNGSLLVDDVEDEAALRRGGPTIHREYGRDVALNAGNALYFLPFRLLERTATDLDSATQCELYRRLTAELMSLHVGQGMDVHWHSSPRPEVAPASYLEMSARKTGSLARLSTDVPAIVTNQPPAVREALRAYATDVAVAFQISDDVLDVETAAEHGGSFGKEFGNDIKEGKVTLLTIAALEQADSADERRLREVLADDDPDRDDVADALAVLRETGSVEYARDQAIRFGDRARSHLEGLDLRTEPMADLEAFAAFAVERVV
ncbi:polyprenyl synthetase family protein [Halorubellus sp. JP-L1]|uniref:polyprenyl synthetase family protein n=1 Tax=Halorubellus sp. JP-L1 TaxID=2715753 RepID=UPI00140A5CFF|nr:polyprenyl synthetase family protein [Halorubellus sp. JP-L1]NHN41881.1 polyprenyl synthetase family protein [Halorubellus sp. JP-L1]